MPIATPMSAAFSAGASLTPSPVIATTSPSACSASTMRSLCAGRRGRRPTSSGRHLAQLLGVERVELGAGDGGGAGTDDAEVRRRCARRSRVIAGDHDHADAGAMRLGDGDGRLRARRVDDPDDADVDEVVLVALIEVGPVAPAVDVERAVGHAERA